LIGLLTLAPIPALAYRAYALGRARYQLSRNSLLLQWGLRVEEIPLSDIEWMRMAADLTHPLRLPAFRVPGSVLGLRRHPDLGMVEFIASDPDRLLLVATARRTFAISPERPAELMRSFLRATEMGSLGAAQARSVHPSFVIADTWARPMVRFIWLATALLNAGLFAWVSTLIPELTPSTPGEIASSREQALSSSAQLILLPVASLALSVAGWLTGLYLYRWERERPLAFIVWLSSALTSSLFVIAVAFVLSAPK
jgi:hypothetical protein